MAQNNTTTKGTHWRQILQSEYLGGPDLDDGFGKLTPIVATIKRAGTKEIIGEGGRKESCLVVEFQERIKPLILNVTNSKRIEKLAKSPYLENWPGTKITIGTERVKAFGEIHNAIRISEIPPKANAAPAAPIVPCSDCGDTIKSVGNTPVEKIIAGTEKTYGAALCMECATKRKEVKE